MGEILMFKLSKSRAYSIGVDVGDDNIKLVQLGENGSGIIIVAGKSENLPEGIKAGSSQWQRWAIDTIRQMTSNSDFRGKEVVASMPYREVFIDNIKMPKADAKEIEDAIFSKIKQKLPFEPIKENTMIKYIPMEHDNTLVVAVERKTIDRHLAIYEKAGLSIKSIGIWPIALANCYNRFFGRRQPDTDTTVLLVCIEKNCTNVVICRHKNLLYARSLSIGLSQLNNKKSVNKLVLDLTECRRQFDSMNPRGQIERLIFLSSQTTIDRETCVTIAKQLDIPAQVGDCLAAVEITEPSRLGGKSNSKEEKDSTRTPINRRNCEANWATAFGLSLS
jgi:Tfp pilus assembly PilM family ATPase